MLLYIYLFIWYDRAFFVFLGTSFLFGLIIVVPIKKKINRKRPFEEMKDIVLLEREQISNSFPSWHMYNIVAQGLTFGYLFNSPLIAILLRWHVVWKTKYSHEWCLHIKTNKGDRDQI